MLCSVFILYNIYIILVINILIIIVIVIILVSIMIPLHHLIIFWVKPKKREKVSFPVKKHACLKSLNL